MDIASSTPLTFTPGQIVGIDCRCFRGIRQLRILAGPHINYFVAPNGMGKTSILYAIALCLGSGEGYVQHTKTLIHTDASEAFITLALCATPNLPISEAHCRFEESIDCTTTLTSLFIPGLTVIQVRLRGDRREYFFDGSSSTVEQVRQKVADMYSIRIDNPFQAMMQVNAQRLASMTSDRRFQAFVQFALADIGSGVELLREQINGCRKQASDFAEFRKNVFDPELTKFTRIDEQWKTAQNRERLRQVVRNCRELGRLIKILNNGKFHESLIQELNELSTKVRDCETEEAAAKEELESANTNRKDLETSITNMMAPLNRLQPIDSRVSMITSQNMNFAELLRRYREVECQYNQKEFAEEQVVNSRKSNREKIAKLKAEESQLRERGREITVQIERIRMNQALGTGSSRIREIQGEIQKLRDQFRKHEDFIYKLNSHHHGIQKWLEHVQKSATPDEAMITFAPIVQYFGIVPTPVIPKNTLRRVVYHLTRSILFSVVTGSFSLANRLTDSLEQFAEIGAVSDVIMLRLDGMALEEYEARSHEMWEWTFQPISLNMMNITTFRPSDIISIHRSITGRPSILRELIPVFKGVYYLKLRQEHFQLIDIERLFQNNKQVVQIVFTDTTIYKARSYGNQYAGYITLSNMSQDERDVIIETIDEYPPLPSEIKAKIDALEREKDEEEHRSREKTPDTQYRELNEEFDNIQKRMKDIQNGIREAKKNIEADETVLKGKEGLKESLETGRQKLNDIQKEITCSILGFIEEGRVGYQRLRKIGPHIEQYRCAKDTSMRHLRQYEAIHAEVTKLKRHHESKLVKCKDAWSTLKTQLQDFEDNYRLKVMPSANDTDPFDMSPLKERMEAIMNDQDFKGELDQYRRMHQMFEESLTENDIENFQAWVNAQNPSGPVSGVSSEKYAEYRGKLRDIICEILSKTINLARKLRDIAAQIILISRHAEVLITSASTRFRENMKRFGVTGDLRLTGVPGEKGIRAIEDAQMWIETALGDPLEFVQIDQLHHFLDLFRWTGDFDEACAGLRRALSQMCNSNTMTLSRYIDDMFQGSFIQALARAIPHTNAGSHFKDIINECENVNPGMQIDTEFAQGERLRDISLSGGERSVVSLCIVNSLRGENAFDTIPFRLVDEINQGLDDNFEQAAHEMLCSTSELQYFISSPKLPSYLRFDRDEILVHVLIRPPVPLGFVELYPKPADTTDQ
ncbi:RecF/RecN/SMC N terminal domain-containing protein [Giardia muris]|uniref:Structural maintenance of chromosomes protein 5 n=1 Tax=Giardia muris TaxID=5742 RepID=A0A4Z1SUT7_GIAMU|nr:RecF/RecN/SMC N terminal domain-containing protein [Giardia muris]|eukprot:TNJ28715.1 RecF/RecN/SMC N terminal domain-containing protein [Giardia muris]